MKTAPNPYGDPILVPRNWYETIHCYQIVVGSRTMGYPPGFEPVVLRGAEHCRRFKRGSARAYGTEVLTRYVRRLRLTETDPRRWFDWLHTKLLPIATHRHWWPHQRACMQDLRSMVSDYSAVIDGKEFRFYTDAARRNVRALHKAVKSAAQGVSA
jgi:hypothetical protein